MSDTPTVNLILPYPPATNNLYFDNIVMPKKGRAQKPYVVRVLSKAGKDYKQTVAEVADGLNPFIGDVAVNFKVFRPRRIGDLDGVFKIVLDGLSGHVFNDDRQVVELHAFRYDDKRNPRVEVEVKVLGLC